MQQTCDTAALQGSDDELVMMAQQGDTRASDLLVARRRDAVRNFIRTLVHDPGDAEDLTQDTFLRAYLNVGRFRLESSFLTWLLPIAKSVVRNRVRVKSEVPLGGIDPTSRENRGLDWRVVECEESEAVRLALRALPAPYRQALVMREFKGLSYKEIAGLLTLPTSTVTTRLHTARRLLKERMARLYPY